MAAFDRDNVTRNKTLGIPTRSNTPAWIAGIVIVVGAIIGVYASSPVGARIRAWHQPQLKK